MKRTLRIFSLLVCLFPVHYLEAGDYAHAINRFIQAEVSYVKATVRPQSVEYTAYIYGAPGQEHTRIITCWLDRSKNSISGYDETLLSSSRTCKPIPQEVVVLYYNAIVKKYEKLSLDPYQPLAYE